MVIYGHKCASLSGDTTQPRVQCFLSRSLKIPFGQKVSMWMLLTLALPQNNLSWAWKECNCWTIPAQIPSLGRMKDDETHEICHPKVAANHPLKCSLTQRFDRKFLHESGRKLHFSRWNLISSCKKKHPTFFFMAETSNFLRLKLWNSIFFHRCSTCFLFSMATLDGTCLFHPPVRGSPRHLASPLLWPRGSDSKKWDVCIGFLWESYDVDWGLWWNSDDGVLDAYPIFMMLIWDIYG